MASENAVKNFVLVVEGINKETESIVDFKALNNLFNQMGQYYSIIHDKDYNEHGELKRLHYHFVLRCYDKIRKTTLINKIAKKMGIQHYMIQCDPCSNVRSSIRYLLHLDDPDKTLYAPFDCKTNDNEGLTLSLENAPNNYTVDSIYSIVYIAKGNRFQIAKAMGCNEYIRYEKIVKVCCDEYFRSYANTKD